MEHGKIKEILRRPNEANIPYAMIDGIVLAHYCPPCTTQDLHLMVLASHGVGRRYEKGAPNFPPLLSE